MLNLPNCITLVRILLVFVFAYAVSMTGIGSSGSALIQQPPAFSGYFSPADAFICLALWSFVVGAITDFLDGYLARRLNSVTNLGKLIDPLADKMLVSTAFIYLTAVGVCPFWVTVLIIFREFLVTGLRQMAAARGVIMAADRLGKWKTAAQLTYCITALVGLTYGSNTPQPFRCLSTGFSGFVCVQVLMWTSLILTLWSGANYCIRNRHLFRD
ncbi:MAG: CDP-diacylglycerol--glycerol-3-phosphate 3-phosphatidyltransferase [Akkermansia muciniphila]